MANGTAAIAVARVLAPEPAPAAVNKPAAVSSEVERRIGAAVAAAVGGLAWAISDFADRGAVSSSAKAWCGTMIGGLAQMRLDLLGDPLVDFDVIAYREGKRAFQGHPSEVFLTHLGPGQVDAVISELIGRIITISSKIVDTELALRAN
jgi:hypothetical protein